MLSAPRKTAPLQKAVGSGTATTSGVGTPPEGVIEVLLEPEYSGLVPKPTVTLLMERAVEEVIPPVTLNTNSVVPKRYASPLANELPSPVLVPVAGRIMLNGFPPPRAFKPPKELSYIHWSGPFWGKVPVSSKNVPFARVHGADTPF